MSNSYTNCVKLTLGTAPTARCLHATCFIVTFFYPGALHVEQCVSCGNLFAVMRDWSRLKLKPEK